jgi:hypothetical protein
VLSGHVESDVVRLVCLGFDPEKSGIHRFGMLEVGYGVKDRLYALIGRVRHDAS